MHTNIHTKTKRVVPWPHALLLRPRRTDRTEYFHCGTTRCTICMHLLHLSSLTQHHTRKTRLPRHSPTIACGERVPRTRTHTHTLCALVRSFPFRAVTAIAPRPGRESSSFPSLIHLRFRGCLSPPHGNNQHSCLAAGSSLFLFLCSSFVCGFLQKVKSR